jgi:hypothetical protein
MQIDLSDSRRLLKWKIERLRRSPGANLGLHKKTSRVAHFVLDWADEFPDGKNAFLFQGLRPDDRLNPTKKVANT